MLLLEERRTIIATAKLLHAESLVHGREGNVSLRAGNSILITPTNMDYEALKPSDIISVSNVGTTSGKHSPSSEWQLHLSILSSRSEINAVVHTHSVFATALACQGLGIPSFHYMVALAGGADIRCAPYATFGTQALAQNTIVALKNRRACLLAYHGMIAIGETIDEAAELTREVEHLAELYWRVRLLGKPKLLTSVEMEKTLKRFTTRKRQSTTKGKGKRGRSS
jgi:L-fuculose-phosphate aldolase